MLYDSLERVQRRVTVWLEPWTDEEVYCSLNGALEYRQNCDSYQLVKACTPIANGGYGGTGIGSTFQTVDGTQLIPYLQTDFIYSAIAQELGLIRAAAVLPPVPRAGREGDAGRARRARRLLELLAAGLAFGFALQTFIIVGGVLRIVPLSRGSRSRSSRTGVEHRLELRDARAPDARLPPRRADGADVNRQLTRVRVGGDGAHRRPGRQHDVLADLGPAGPRGASGQRSGGVAEFQIRREADPRADARAGPQPPGGGAGGKTLYFRKYPQGSSRRTSSATRPSHGAARGWRSP